MLKLYFSPDAFDYNLTPLRLRMINAWRAHDPQTEPGTKFAYANFGYLIAGAMLEKATGVPWEEMITRRIFAPLKLSSAGLGAQATTGKIDAPVGHQVADDGRVTPMLWGAAADLPPAVGPAGVAHMSVLDFARWGAWNAGAGHRGPALVTPETLARIHQAHIDTGKIPNPRPGVPGEGAYALGWGVVKFEWSHGPVLTHNGSNSMNLAKILVDTAKDVAVVLVTNSPGNKADDACNAALPSLYQHYAPA
jgi:CubicO group peptidase (beta-lactamase class C family)